MQTIPFLIIFFLAVFTNIQLTTKLAPMKVFISHLLHFHTETHYTKPPAKSNRWSRSRTSGQCSTNQQSNNNPSSNHFIIHTLFIQTLTTLNLEETQIGLQGVEHLANALQINKVTTTLLPITSSFTHFSHRHSPH